MVQEQGIESDTPSTSSTGSSSYSSGFAANVRKLLAEDTANRCSLCREKKPLLTDVKPCSELKPIRDYIEAHSLVRNVHSACQTCLYKLYAVLEQNIINDSQTDQYFSVSSAESRGIRELVLNRQLSKSVSALSVDNEAQKVKPDADNESNYASSISSRLCVLYERTESALITESGGNVERNRADPLRCQHCSKSFVLQKPYLKHLQSHRKRAVRSRSVPTHTVYACLDCSATFPNNKTLKKHSRVHLKRYFCRHCQKQSLSEFDHNIHEAVCEGKRNAIRKTFEGRRITRSMSRSVPSENVPRILRRRAKTDAEDNDEENCVVRENDDDGAASVAYTEYNAFNGYVEMWVEGTRQNAQKRKSILKNSSKYATNEPIIVSRKEYDIIMLEKLILQSDINVYPCTHKYPTAGSCEHATNSLRELCIHQITSHKYPTNFWCRKCRGWFTSKVFLDYHLYLQNYGEYHCHKCTKLFNYEYELQYHLIQHQLNPNFPCHYCSNNFVSNGDLQVHCLETGHDPKKRKKQIYIDHTMTITNKTENEPPPAKRAYNCQIKILNLPKTPTKRPMQITKSQSRILGDLDFEYQPGRNCVRPK